ncbi:receptor-like protein 9DC1 [Phaseolus vulgaris]|uniref:receptor-like protein 9DC1 n=1 Tax=Phaseolus vulgaris TaxID=3885 RepID=UPI0035CB7844
MWSSKFLFVVLSCLVFHFPSDTSSLVQMPLCNHHDASALLSFKSLFTLTPPGPGWCAARTGVLCHPKTESWRNVTDCCMWEGVSCDTKSGHVIGLDLSCSCISGELHPNSTLFQLTHLQTLNLVLNDFYDSPMPSGFGHLLALTHLNLSLAWFTGVIPSKFCHLSKLVSLGLGTNNGLTIEQSTLEKLIVNATDLRELNFDYLDMSLIKPSSLSLLLNLSVSLVSLRLQNSSLRGKLDNAILCLPNLQYLHLSKNPDLEVELPKFNSSTPLRYLDLGDITK